MFLITRSAVSAADAAAVPHMWPVSMTAVHSVDSTPAKIFVMQTAAPDELSENTLSCVASAIQMHDLPEDVASSEGPFFRQDSFVALSRSAEAAEELVEKVYDAIQDLTNNLEASETLSIVEAKIITPGNSVQFSQ